jgi:hypothetical protein
MTIPKARPRHNDYQRKTVKLTGTTYRSPAHLDARSLAAGVYAQVWLAHAGARKVPMSGVLRRALEFYTTHLNKPDTNRLHEVTCCIRSCEAFTMDRDTQAEVLLRLKEAESVTRDQPLPSFRDVLNGPEWAAQFERTNARAEELFQQYLTNKRTR